MGAVQPGNRRSRRRDARCELTPGSMKRSQIDKDLEDRARFESWAKLMREMLPAVEAIRLIAAGRDLLLRQAHQRKVSNS